MSDFRQRAAMLARMLRTASAPPDVVINLPSVAQVTAVDRLSLTTGRDPVPADKAQVGYRHAADKFALAGATAVPSATIAPPRVAECPVSLEGRVVATHPLHARDPAEAGSASVFEVAITRVHVHPMCRMRLTRTGSTLIGGGP